MVVSLETRVEFEGEYDYKHFTKNQLFKIYSLPYLRRLKTKDYK